MKGSLSKYGLNQYVQLQLQRFFPDNSPVYTIENALPEALRRLEVCINSVKLWTPSYFNHLHSSQYCTFLYLLARTAYEQNASTEICTKLFLLNKALNGIDLFYEIKMPSKFFIGHSTGIVLAKANYGEHLVLYQNCTVGKNNGISPTLGQGNIIYPNAAVLGNSTTGDYTTISQGTRLIDTSTPPRSIVFNKNGQREAIIKKARRLYIDDYFRNI